MYHTRIIRKSYTSHTQIIQESHSVIYDTPLNVVPKYKYLGIYLDQHLAFDDCTTVLSDAAGRALGVINN